MRALLALALSVLSCNAAFFSPFTDNGEQTMPSHDSISTLTNNITITFWVSRIADQVVGSAVGGIINKGATYWIRAGNGPAEFLNSGTGGATAQWDTTANYTTTNVISFWALTFTMTDTNSLRLYLDGTNYAGRWIWMPTNSAGTSNNTPLVLGASGEAAARWNGYYSEFAIWNAILNGSELQALYASRVKGLPKQIRPSNLKLYLPLDSAPDSTIIGASVVFPDRSNFENFFLHAYLPGGGGHDSSGMAERILSYQPNE